jgi:CHAT domain-containing protein
MMASGPRPRSWPRLALTLALCSLTATCLTVACQSAARVGEAKHDLITSMPRTSVDIIGMLDQQQRADLEAWSRKVVLNPLRMARPGAPAEADFYRERGLAAGRIGRAKQEIDDLTYSSWFYLRTPSPTYQIYFDLAMAEERGGNFFRHLQHLRKALEAAGPVRAPYYERPLIILPNARLAIGYASIGHLQTAEANLEEAARRYNAATPGFRTDRELFAQAQAVLLDVTGRHAEAEAVGHKVIAMLAADSRGSRATQVDELHAFLTGTLIRQGRLLEAENEAREAALGALTKAGRYSPHTAWMLRSLTWVFLEQGRYREAEALARAVIDIYEKTETAPDSLRFATARADLATALSLQGRDQESLREYETIQAGLSRDRESLEEFFAANVRYGELMLKTGRVDQALELFGVALDRSTRLVGEAHRETGENRGFLARTYAAKGDARRALREFRKASALWTARWPGADGDSAEANRRLVTMLDSYIGQLAAIRGSALEREMGVDAIAETFRLADVARTSSVQRALGASAARAAAGSPGLAAAIRAQQDAKTRIRTLYREMADVLSEPGSESSASIGKLRGRIEAQRLVIEALTARIEREFPVYAELIDPRPVTVEQVRAVLRPGEALIAMLVTPERTFVWAVPQSGPPAFAMVPMSANAIAETVASLRRALEPNATILGDIPDFDLAGAYRLYSALLEPVRSGWQDARSLLVVPHGSLGELPLALLPTRPTDLPPENGAMFSNYRQVPWLVRSHAVTTLPSVASLGALRAIPPGDPRRRPFVGFGDPYFSKEQAALAADEPPTSDVASATQARDVVALSMRAAPVRFRGSSEAFDSRQLARLPRLPDTAEEIRALAGAANADHVRDVFLGARANEGTVKAQDLASYRVIAFATHGLVPGDLDGLSQPALALSAPDVADVDGDGLLTMDEILSLRLNADWVVLSACNTGSGQGAGSEAVSGLGRAFLYAGARALLVSNWPVETTSARALTTELFRRQHGRSMFSRAEALQETMNWLIDHGAYLDAASGRTVFSYAHPIFWAPFTLIGDGGGEAPQK